MSCKIGEADGCTPDGCGSKGHCSSGGCNRFNSFDWLSGIEDNVSNHNNVDEWLEVRFKNNRKGFYLNFAKTKFYLNEFVVVEANNGGFDIGQISLKGELVKLQMRKKMFVASEPFPLVLRKASVLECSNLASLRKMEKDIYLKVKDFSNSYNLNVKISEVEFYGDGQKIIVYFVSDKRIDFRDFVRKCSQFLNVRVEMRQINPRQETALLGGLGVCGRELCCSNWLTEFKNVSSSAARYQQLSINPAKISGLCGRLKCCLNFELNTYLESFSEFPRNLKTITTKEGVFDSVKVDILSKKIWFTLQKSFQNQLDTAPFSIPVFEVNSILKEIAIGNTDVSIAKYLILGDEKSTKYLDEFYVDKDGGKIDRLDSKKKKKKFFNNHRK